MRDAAGNHRTTRCRSEPASFIFVVVGLFGKRQMVHYRTCGDDTGRSPLPQHFASSSMIEIEKLEWGLVVAFVLHSLGFLTAIHAIMTARTSQGAIAWALLLILFPYTTLPAYGLFGRGKFQGYVKARRAGDSQIDHIARVLEKKMHLFRVREENHPKYSALEQLAEMPFTTHNDAKLHINGREAFPAMFAGMEGAKDYVIVQFYIINDDLLGRQLKEILERKAREGVRVYLLFDEIGSYQLPKAYRRELAEAGVIALRFRTSRGLRNRFQINFRNHRKIVIADGQVAYVGGFNIGDEYMGRHPKLGPWRDTLVEVRGPIVQAIQFAFLEDWYWATGDVPDLDWTPLPAPEGDETALCLASDPSDELETCGLFFMHAINSAQRRIWIASPYFVPDTSLIQALQLAALRGVDVRVMLPQKPDHKLVYLAAFSYIAEAEPSGVKFYRFVPGFMHHKVILVDDDLAAVGTANFDNRSVRLNFEIMVVFASQSFAQKVSDMLEADFTVCLQVRVADFAAKPYLFHFAVRLARLMAPVL
jgi:cardiolipin synthase